MISQESHSEQFFPADKAKNDPPHYEMWTAVMLTEHNWSNKHNILVRGVDIIIVIIIACVLGVNGPFPWWFCLCAGDTVKCLYCLFLLFMVHGNGSLNFAAPFYFITYTFFFTINWNVFFFYSVVTCNRAVNEPSTCSMMWFNNGMFVYDTSS